MDLQHSIGRQNQLRIISATCINEFLRVWCEIAAAILRHSVVSTTNHPTDGTGLFSHEFFLEAELQGEKSWWVLGTKWIQVVDYVENMIPKKIGKKYILLILLIFYIYFTSWFRFNKLQLKFENPLWWLTTQPWGTPCCSQCRLHRRAFHLSQGDGGGPVAWAGIRNGFRVDVAGGLIRGDDTSVCIHRCIYT